VVDVHHDLELVWPTECVAQRGHQRERVVDVPRDRPRLGGMDLDGAVARAYEPTDALDVLLDRQASLEQARVQRHVRPMLAAEQGPDGDAERPSLDVVQCDIDGADRRGVRTRVTDPVAAGERVPPQDVGGERVLPDVVGSDLHHRMVRERPAMERRFAPTLEALIGPDPDENEPIMDEVGLDLGYPHLTLPRESLDLERSRTDIRRSLWGASAWP
jgi:hypothetical protein